MGRASIFLVTARFTVESGRMGGSKAKASALGLMGEGTRVSGWTTRNTVMGYTPGRMAASTKGITKTTKSMGQEPIIGQTGADISGSGKMTSGMGRANIT